ncbi:MAG: DUF2474 domain-containing protein [Celeribacter sp.]|jgi:hypothetical protein
MPDTTERPERPAHPARPAPAQPRRHWLRRVGWFIVIWSASVTALGMVAYVIRLAVIPG